jgi:hypothetical protein
MRKDLLKVLPVTAAFYGMVMSHGAVAEKATPRRQARNSK